MQGLKGVAGVELLPLDLNSSVSIREAVAQVVSRAGRIDILVRETRASKRASKGPLCTHGWLSEVASPRHSFFPLPRVQVNNAGVVTLGPAAEVPLEAARQCFESNVFGLLELCQVSSPHRLAQIPRTRMLQQTCFNEAHL